jgi:hypothetical protein
MSHCKAFAVLLVVLAGACARLHVHPILPVDEESTLPPPAPSVSVRITGEEAARADFARAYSYYRIFSSRLENETGSLHDLLLPGVTESLRRKGLGVCENCSDLLEINISRSRAVWLPPREFIETPTPKERGEVIVEFRIETVFRGKPLLPFEHNRAIRAFPGEETNVLSLEVRRALRSYLEWLMGQLSAG